MLESPNGRDEAAAKNNHGTYYDLQVRTKAWSYSVGNLDGLTLLANIGERVGVALWNYHTSDGRSIRRAFNYLVPFAFGAKKWPDQQIGEWQPEILFPLIRGAAARYQDQEYRALMKKVPEAQATDRSNLTL